MSKTGVESMVVDSVLESSVAVECRERGGERTRVKVARAAAAVSDGACCPKFVVHELGSDDNRFLDTVVDSIKFSAGINLRAEGYL